VTAITRVQSNHAANAASGGSLPCALSGIADKSLILIATSFDTAGGTTGSRVEDDLGKGAQLALRTFAGGFNQMIEVWFYCNYYGGSRTFFLINSPAQSNRTIVVAERAGGDLNAPLDGTASANGSSATPASGNVSPAPTLDGGTLFAIAAGSAIPAPTSPLVDVWADSTSFSDTADLLQAVAAAIGASWTMTSGAWEAISAFFKPAITTGVAFDSVAFDSVAFDAGATLVSVSQSATSAYESLATPIKSIAASYEATAALSKAVSAAYESIVVLSATSSASYETTIGVSQTAQQPYEALLGLSQTGVEPYEAIAIISKALSASYETLILLSASSSESYESNVSTAQSAIDAYEKVAGVSAVASTSPYEALTSLVKTLSDAYESLLALSQSGAVPWEAQGVPLFSVSQSATTPYEALTRLVQLSSSGFESSVILSASSSSSTEQLLGVAKALTDAFEALAIVTRSTDSSFEALPAVIAQSATGDYESLLSVLSQAQPSDYEILRAVVALATTATEILGYIVKASTSSFESKGAKIELPPYDVAIDENLLDVVIEPDAANALSSAATTFSIDASFDLDAELSEV